jgi:uncharacterized SAM-binding protein YcdF (DUF218 family)
MNGIIIVLGSQNDPKGNLSPNAKNRMDRAIEELKKSPDYKLLLTGGFGKFNTTSKSHACYLKKYALDQGIQEDDILEIVESGNTVEDAYLSKPILDKYKPGIVFVSTSNFHLPRAKFIFEKILPEYKLEFLGSKENTSPLVLKKLKLHEKMALAAMKIAGIYLPNGKIIR